MNPVFLPWTLQIGVITYRTMSGDRFTVTRTGASGPFGLVVQRSTGNPKRPPLPSELLSSFIIYGAYAFIANGGPERQRIGALLGWGTLLATVLFLTNSNPPGGDITRGQAPGYMGPLPSKPVPYQQPQGQG